MIGATLAHYKISLHLGSGGMGEVYQATDSKLGRDVAIKLLPQEFARDPERISRFEREARVLASLNHPNIAAIHGLEESEGQTFLVMELVSGETLAHRIARGSIAIEDALTIASQIADALEAAHDRGVVHRDLKPANVKVREDGTVKVLDFGLATAATSGTQELADRSNSPTLMIGGTQAGVILGTAAYMSPEQAAGKAVDRRADIWSFGVVLWEMLMGRSLFGSGETVSHMLADVLRAEIDFEKLPDGTPSGIRELLERCLDRDVKTRLRDIGEARVAIQRWLSNPSVESKIALSSRPGWISWSGWVAALFVVIAVAIWFSRPTSPRPGSVIRFTNTLSTSLVEDGLALSRDGSRLAFVGGPDQQIYVRMMDQLEAKLLAGTEGARFLSFSPDGQWISFTTSGRPRPFGAPSPQNRVKKIALSGGAAVVLADAPARGVPTFQDWGEDDYILFGSDEGLQKVSSNGGPVQTLAKPDPQRGERFYAGAQLLPDGRTILATITKTPPVRDIVAINPQTGQKKVLLEKAGGIAYYLPQAGSTTGHIIYYASDSGSLMALPFDAERLEVHGTPVPVLEGVREVSTVYGGFAFSENGTLAYVPGAAMEKARSLVWVDRTGVEQPVPAPARQYNLPRLSSDGQRVAVEIQDPSAGSADVWIYDLVRGDLSRMTFASANTLNVGPLWTPDDKRLIYGSGPLLTALSLVSVPTDRSSPPSVLLHEAAFPDAISPDGKFILLRGNLSAARGNTLLLLRLDGATANGITPQTVLDTTFTKADIEFSPDSHFFAYQSNESGPQQIYVQSFPGPGGKWTISIGGGTLPRWARSGRELFYRVGNRMMVVEVELTASFRAGKPKLLFEGGPYQAGYDVAPDGSRFLMVKAPPPEQAPDQLHIVVNWVRELHRRVPLAR